MHHIFIHLDNRGLRHCQCRHDSTPSNSNFIHPAQLKLLCIHSGFFFTRLNVFLIILLINGELAIFMIVILKYKHLDLPCTHSWLDCTVLIPVSHFFHWDLIKLPTILHPVLSLFLMLYITGLVFLSILVHWCWPTSWCGLRRTPFASVLRYSIRTRQ